ncbi:SET domain-containing protein SmydA-8 [Episyrphus balteatus]|uniref:SET domain-containing protein SmydA-8 n=1 Tax=Episyrphus balteatus TaxID=286459 RepID=UPI0024855A49|nr:SET domain-containing protein SmydA-8 [Episyrphus balteatus]
MTDSRNGFCKICSKETKSKCSNCNQVYYCSGEHQKSDWKNHKQVCHPFKIEQTEKLGRHLVTTRKIKPHEIILKESPLTRGPSQVTGPVCLGCLDGVDEENYVPCQECGWPLCSKECEGSAEHREECKLTQNREQKKVVIHEFTTPHPMYQCIAALRALLLKKTDKQKYEKLLKLESHEDIRRGSPQWKVDLESIGKFIPRFFQTKEFTEDEIMKMAGILQINGHEVPTSDPPHVAVFETASMVEHSCKPNVAKSFTKNGNLILWAPHAILKDTNLSICYSDALWGTGDRQRHLMHTKLFKCECVRCQDVTEFKTYYSALKCKNKDCSGFVLPSDLKNWYENWRCSACKNDVDKIYVSEILEKAGTDLAAMEKNVPNCIKFIEHYQKWLPRKHYYISEVKIQLVQKLGADPKDLMVLSEKDLDTKLEYAKEMIELYEQLAPCETRILGILCFEVHSAVAEKTRRISLETNMNCIELLGESLSYVEKAIEYLKHESNVFAEGLVCQQAIKNRDALKMVMSF